MLRPLAVLFLLLTCGMAQDNSGAAPASAAATGPAPDANLFIYRDHAEPTVWKPTVKIDGRKVIALGEDRYTAIRVAPGPHKVELSWPVFSGQKGGGMTFTMGSDEIHYLEVVGTSRYAGGYGYMMNFKMGSGIGDARPAHAKATIAACCKYDTPK